MHDSNLISHSVHPPQEVLLISGRPCAPPPQRNKRQIWSHESDGTENDVPFPRDTRMHGFAPPAFQSVLALLQYEYSIASEHKRIDSRAKIRLQEGHQQLLAVQRKEVEQSIQKVNVEQQQQQQQQQQQAKAGSTATAQPAKEKAKDGASTDGKDKSNAATGESPSDQSEAASESEPDTRSEKEKLISNSLPVSPPSRAF